MFKNVIAASLITLAIASAVQAAVATFVLSISDNGTGTRTLPVGTTASYAVYGFTSIGDNSGFASFNFTVTGQTTTVNRSPQATFADDNEIGDNKTSGFTLLRSGGGNGVATTGSFDTVSGNGLIVYGVGQTGPANIQTQAASQAPAGYSPASPLAQGNYGVTKSFTVPNEQGFVLQTGTAVPVLLGTGTYAIGSFPTLTAGLFALFNTNQNGTSSLPTTVNFISRDLNFPEPAGLAVFGLAGGRLVARRRRTA